MTITPRRVLSAAMVSAAAILASAALLATGWYAYAQSSTTRRDEAPQRATSPERWEYLIVSGGNLSVESGENAGRNKQRAFEAEASAVERNLDTLGEEGWELVAVSASANRPAYFLKRPKRR